MEINEAEEKTKRLDRNDVIDLVMEMCIRDRGKGLHKREGTFNGCRAIRRQNETGVEDTQQLYVNVLYLLLVESWDIRCV